MALCEAQAIHFEEDESFDYVDQEENENREGFAVEELIKALNAEISNIKELGVYVSRRRARHPSAHDGLTRTRGEKGREEI